jgi:hypothetical protein
VSGFRHEHSDYGEFHRQLGDMYWWFDEHQKLALSEFQRSPSWGSRIRIYPSPVHKRAYQDLKKFRCHARDLFLGWLPDIDACNEQGLWPAIQKWIRPFCEKVAHLFWDMNELKVQPQYRWPTDDQIRQVFEMLPFAKEAA